MAWMEVAVAWASMAVRAKGLGGRLREVSLSLRSRRLGLSTTWTRMSQKQMAKARLLVTVATTAPRSCMELATTPASRREERRGREARGTSLRHHWREEQESVVIESGQYKSKDLRAVGGPIQKQRMRRFMYMFASYASSQSRMWGAPDHGIHQQKYVNKGILPVDGTSVQSTHCGFPFHPFNAGDRTLSNSGQLSKRRPRCNYPVPPFSSYHQPCINPLNLHGNSISRMPAAPFASTPRRLKRKQGLFLPSSLGTIIMLLLLGRGRAFAPRFAASTTTTTPGSAPIAGAVAAAVAGRRTSLAGFSSSLSSSNEGGSRGTEVFLYIPPT